MTTEGTGNGDGGDFPQVGHVADVHAVAGNHFMRSQSAPLAEFKGAAQMLAAPLGLGHFFSRASRNHRPLVFGPGGGVDEPFAALRRAGVDLLSEGLKRDSRLHQLVEKQNGFNRRTERPVNGPNDKNIATFELLACFLQPRPESCRRADSVVDEYLGAPCPFERCDLLVGGLPVSGHPRIAHTSFRGFRLQFVAHNTLLAESKGNLFVGTQPGAEGVELEILKARISVTFKTRFIFPKTICAINIILPLC